MKARLNLTIDENLLAQIKRYAASRKSSISGRQCHSRFCMATGGVYTA